MDEIDKGIFTAVDPMDENGVDQEGHNPDPRASMCGKSHKTQCDHSP